MPADDDGLVALAPLPSEAAGAFLRPPWIPAPDGIDPETLHAAAVARIPIRLVAPAAGGRLRLARALHAVAGIAGPLVAAVGTRPAFERLPAGAALYVDPGVLAPESVLALEALLDDGAAWAIAGVEPATELPAPLRARLDAVAIAVPPLSSRPGDLAALATAILARFAERAGRPAPTLTPAVLAQLDAHSWSGDVAELEAVLGRAFVATRGPGIAVEALGLGVERPATPEAVETVPDEGALEFLLAELAHELRNPLVTIKTLARHLPAMVDDAELRGRFSTLSDEAVERMDGLLENVLEFARLGVPRWETVDVATLLDRVVAELGPTLNGRRVRVERPGALAPRCAGDPSHLSYALRNLLAGVAREVPAREELVLDAAVNGVVTVRFATGGAPADRLRRLVAAGTPNGDDGGLGDPTLLPLSFRLARAALARGGGALEVVPGPDEATTVIVRLPTAGTDVAGPAPPGKVRGSHGSER